MNTTPRRTAAALVTIGSLVLSPALLAGSAAANEADAREDDICSKGSSVKLKASPEDGEVEVEGEVDSNVNRQEWGWSLLHDGLPSASGIAFTAGPSGSFEVEKLFAGGAGTHEFTFTATGPGGETCTVSLTFPTAA